MNQTELLNLIQKYQRGECLPSEKEILENYLESFQNNSSKWVEGEMGEKDVIEENIYSAILKNIEKRNNRVINSIFYSPLYFNRAASIIFILILGAGIVYVSGIFRQKTDSGIWHTEIASAGEKLMLVLPDSSHVVLNAGSTLRYHDKFVSEQREVYLEGEGYFEVRRNSRKPFLVHTENITTTVLGTTFDVSAYPENKIIAVTLLTGKVKVSRGDHGEENNVAFLKPHEKLLYDKVLNLSSFTLYDSLESVGWKDNVYKYENEPLRNVLFQLERAFGVKFRTTDHTVLSKNITFTFDNNSLQTVVGVINNLTGLEYTLIKKEDSTQEVLFTKKKK
jgi:transmembrane sensor